MSRRSRSSVWMPTISRSERGHWDSWVGGQPYPRGIISSQIRPKLLWQGYFGRGTLAGVLGRGLAGNTRADMLDD